MSPRIFTPSTMNNVGLFNIKPYEMFEGDLPKKAQELVTEWLTQHTDELQEMWDKQKITKLPPL